MNFYEERKIFGYQKKNTENKQKWKLPYFIHTTKLKLIIYFLSMNNFLNLFLKEKKIIFIITKLFFYFTIVMFVLNE